jgi:phenylalanyl-tRNA synthetase alpha chain
MQLLLRDVVEGLRRAWRCAMAVRRESPIVSVEENYDRLRYPPEESARDARYTRYLNDAVILRTQTSAMILGMLGRLAEDRTPWRTCCSSAPGWSTDRT